jgi:hypothetical protein
MCTGFFDLERLLAPTQPVGDGSHGTEHAPNALMKDHSKRQSHDGRDGENHHERSAHPMEVSPHRFQVYDEHGHEETEPEQAKGEASKKVRHLHVTTHTPEVFVPETASWTHPVAPVSSFNKADSHGHNHAEDKEIAQRVIKPPSYQETDKKDGVDAL